MMQSGCQLIDNTVQLSCPARTQNYYSVFAGPSTHEVATARKTRKASTRGHTFQYTERAAKNTRPLPSCKLVEQSCITSVRSATSGAEQNALWQRAEMAAAARHDHALSATPTAQQRLSTEEFIEQVRRRPAIWKAGVVDKGGKKVASAWRQICMLTWTDFGAWPADTKRTRCLELQYQWKKLKKSFQMEYYRRQKVTGKQKNSHPEFKDYDKLTFLIPSKAKDKKTERAEKDGEDSDEDQDSQNGEDKKFLLSLLSYMQEVPRSQKLALRSEMIQLITKYIPKT